MAVKSARAKQGAIENFGTIRCREQKHTDIGLESVHFHQQRIQSLFAFVIDSSDMHTALAADGVQFINEDDARCMDFSLLKQVSYASSADADKHFNEIASADQKEWHLGFPGDGAGEQCFTCAWRPDKKHTLRDPSAHFLILFWVLEKMHNLLQFKFGFVATSHVIKGNASVGVRNEASATLANREK